VAEGQPRTLRVGWDSNSTLLAWRKEKWHKASEMEKQVFGSFERPDEDNLAFGLSLPAPPQGWTPKVSVYSKIATDALAESSARQVALATGFSVWHCGASM
jgi:hypothetical protein